MNSFSRGVRNAFRNGIRTISIVLILALAIGLALAMTVAREAVNSRISDVKSSIGNSITITAAGMRGFGGGFGGEMGRPGETSSSGSDSANSSSSGNTLTTDDLAKVEKAAHIAKVAATVSARATTGTDTNLESAATLMMRNGSDFANTDSTDSADNSATFKMPIAITGTNDPATLANTLGDITLSSGEMIDGDSSDLTAVIGDQLATKNSLEVGDTFTLFDKTVKVVGILASGDSAENDSANSGPARGRNMSLGSAVVMPLATVQSLSDESDTINSMVATVDNVANTSAAVAAIQETLGTDADGNNIADITSDEDSAQTTLDSLASIKTTSTISLVACGAVAAVIIFLAMLMIVRERRGEIGVLKAIGAKGKMIIGQFVAESLVLTVLASAVGLGIGILAATPLTNTLVSSAENSSSSSNVAGSGLTDASGSAPNISSDESGRPNFQDFAENSAKSLGTVIAKIDWIIVSWALGSAVIIAAIGATAASLVAMKVRPAEAVRAE